MRRVSLNARLSMDAEATGEIEVVLLVFDHPELPAPIRLSTDNTERLSDDPLMYGTRSGWRGAHPISDPYLFVIASAVLPSDLEDTPASAQIVLENLDSDMVGLLQSFLTPATVHMAVVLASSPDLVEAEYADLQLVSHAIDAASISLSITRDEIEAEYWPTGRMSRERFPGLHL